MLCLIASEGTNDYRNLSIKLKKHEINNEHITNMSLWNDLKFKLLKSKIIE